MGLLDSVYDRPKPVKPKKAPSSGGRKSAPSKHREPGVGCAFAKTQDYRIVQTAAQAITAAKDILRYAKQGSCIAYDEEDDSVDGERIILCVGVCPKPGLSYVFMLDHPENDASPKDKAGVRRVVQGLIQHMHDKVLHHGNYDAGKFLELLDSEVAGYTFDTQYSAFAMDSSKHSYSLANIATRHHPEFDGYKDIVQAAVSEGLTVEQGRDVGEFHLAKVSLDDLRWYNGADCDVTKREELRTREHVSLPLVRVYTEAAFMLDEMEKFGPLLDYQQCEALLKIWPKKKDTCATKLRHLAGDPELNPNSHPQLKKLLYETWHIRPVDPEDANTAKETLELLQQREDHSGITALQDYREAKNRVERIDGFKRSADAHAGRVTTVWWATGARTGRLSSGGGDRVNKRNLGNLQNIAKDEAIQNMLVSDLEWRTFQSTAEQNLKSACHSYMDMDWMLSADFSQQELRILAMVANETAMLDMFASGIDIHAAVGSLWSGWSIKELLEDEVKRRIVKAFHFGIIYGLSPKGLQLDLQAQGTKLSLPRVEGFHKSYFKRFNKVREWREDTIAFAAEHEYVENMFGFRVPIDTSGKGEGAWWKNQAVNSPIQGAAHQVLLCAFALMKRDREKYSLVKPQMEIHDQLVNIASLRNAQAAMAMTRQLMEKDTVDMIEREFKIKWTVPLRVDMKIGFRFGGFVKMRDSLLQTVQEVVAKTTKQEKQLQLQLRGQ